MKRKTDRKSSAQNQLYLAAEIEAQARGKRTMKVFTHSEAERYKVLCERERKERIL